MPSPSNIEDTPLTTQELQVYLLRLRREASAGAAPSLARRQVRALLYGLAAEYRPIPRERRHYLFWSATPESEARRALPRLLAHLRGAPLDSDLLVASGDRVKLDAGGGERCVSSM